MQLRTVSPGLVENLGSKCPSINEVVNLLDRQWPGLGKSHASHGRSLNVAGRDGVLGDFLADLSTAVSELSDAEHAVGLAGGDDGLEGFDGVPGLEEAGTQQSCSAEH